MATCVIVRWNDPYQVAYWDGWQAWHVSDETYPSSETAIGRFVIDASGTSRSRVAAMVIPRATLPASSAAIGFTPGVDARAGRRAGCLRRRSDGRAMRRYLLRATT